MRKMIFALAVLAAGPALAADPMAAYYGNTWIFTAPGESKHVLINADNSAEIQLDDGRAFRGTWSQDGKSVCFHVGADKSCFDDLQGRKAGSSWTGQHDGEHYTGLLRDGRGHAGPQKPK